MRYGGATQTQEYFCSRVLVRLFLKTNSMITFLTGVEVHSSYVWSEKQLANT